MASEFDRVLIAIPSLGRPQAIAKKTLALVKDAGITFKVFVESEEAFLYQFYCGKKNVIVLEKSHQGIGYSRSTMRRYAKDNGYDFIFEMDDDVTGFFRVDTDNPQEALRLCVRDFIAIMDKLPKLGGIRTLMFRWWVYTKKDLHKWIKYNIHMMGVVFFRTDAVPQIEKYKHYEDMATTLLMWQNGYFSLNYGLAGLQVLQNTNKGGFSNTDRHKLATEAIEEIQKDFPHCFKKEVQNDFGFTIDADYYVEQANCHPIKFDDDDELVRYIETLK